jgi:O-antigen/teichoic acid export membrane protein
VLNFALVLLLSRSLGVAGFGAYASAYAWASVLAVVAVLGLTSLVIRHTAAYHLSESWGLIRGLLRRTNQAVAASAAATVTVAAGVGAVIYRGHPNLLHPFLIGLALVPLFALTSLRQAAMQGLGRVVLGRVPETILAPGLFIGLTGTAVVMGARFTPALATAFQVAATLTGFAVGALLLRRILPGPIRHAAPRYDTASWRRSALPLLVLNLVMAANAQVGTIMLGAFSNARDAGVFNVAFRVTIFISFVMLAATYPLGPTVARLQAAGERLRVERTVVRAARLVLLVSLPVAVVLVLFATPILSIFGNGFGGGATAVRIMAIGDLVNVLTGFGGLVLVMSGRESDLARGVAFGAVLNVGLAAALIPTLGVDGAAIAMAASLAVSNIVMNWFAWRRLGVWAAVVRIRRHASAT